MYSVDVDEKNKIKNLWKSLNQNEAVNIIFITVESTS